MARAGWAKSSAALLMVGTARVRSPVKPGTGFAPRGLIVERAYSPSKDGRKRSDEPTLHVTGFLSARRGRLWRTFADHSTGDAISRVACRIGHIVILPGVNHDSSTVVLEDGIGFAFLQRDILVR